MKNHKAHNSGFTLVQISILLLVASLVLVTILPSTKSTLDNNKVTYNRLNQLMTYYRAYMAANGALPCPADASLAMGAANYGVAAANSGSTNDCSGSTPAANYVDASNNIAIGMVPYKTLGIPRELIYDSWGRAITYAVDTAVTGSCWSTPATGAITVTDNGSAQNTVIALISHGANGHGAWIPLTGSSGTAVRLNNNSSNSNELTNAHVDSSFAATSTLTNFVITTPSSTFDDVIAYKSPLWTMNARPSAASGAGGSSITNVSTPTSGLYYYTGAFSGILDINASTISFTVTFDSSVTITGTPRLTLTATSVGGGTVSLTGNGGSGATGYANWNGSGSPGTSFTFTYPLQSTDMAPNGFTMATSIDLNGGSITSLCSNSFTAPTLTNVIIPKVQAITASGTWTVPVDWNSTTNYIHAVGSGGNGAAGTATAGGAGGGGGAFAQATGFADPVGSVITVTVGTGGGTAATVFKDVTTLKADYGRNASGTTRGNGGLASNSYPSSSYNGGNGGNNGGTTRGGGGGGGGSAGPGGGYIGRAGGAGANTGGGGGGGGGSNGGANTVGAAGAATGSNGGHGGRGPEGNAVSNRGAAGGGNATNGVANTGAGGGGGGGSNSASVNSGSGGNGATSVFYGTTYYNWNTNVAPVGSYSVGGGGGGSGGANGATSNSGNGGTSSGYGGGGGGSGGATGTPGTAGSGTQGLIVVWWR